MSRLPPALGFQAGAGAGQGPSKQQQAFEQDTGFLMDKVHLLPREAVDASLQVRDQTHFRGDHPIIARCNSTDDAIDEINC